MTKKYELLLEGPQTHIDMSFPPEERVQVRRIKVTGLQGYGRKGTPGKLKAVYYLEGDEPSAARLFVEENREKLERMDFSRQNALKDSLSQEMYDLVLHHLGERHRTRYPTLVVEERPDGTRWLIDRKRYEERPGRRYTIGEGVARVPPEVDLMVLYEGSDELISEDEVQQWPIKGEPREVLDYFRLSSSFECEPVTVGGGRELAVRKLSSK